MQTFRYKAVAADGQAARGTLEASDRRGALDALSARGLFPSLLESTASDAAPAASTTTAIAPAPPSPVRAVAVETRAKSPAVFDIPAGEGRISRREISSFTRQMATLLGAIIPIPSALEGIAEQEQNAALKSLLTQAASDVRRGVSFSAALSSYPRHFPPLYISMVEVGEESGQLAPVLDDLGTYLEEQDAVRGEIKSAVAYPLLVMTLGVATTFVLLTFVMPRLLGLLDGMSDGLPAPTRALLALSAFFQSYWLALLGVVAVGTFAARAYFRTGPGALWWDRRKLRLPVLGKLFTAAALARFARTLGTLHRAGVSLLRALDIVRNTVGNRFLAAQVDFVAEEARGGDSLARPIQKLELFPPTMVQMIKVGEDTGQLDTMLLKVAAIQEAQVRVHSKTLTSLLGPLLILAVGVVVGFIVISLLLPIFQLSQSMR
ncbi:MAG: type II secretion system F family protein [Planctomycetota bacterium]